MVSRPCKPPFEKLKRDFTAFTQEQSIVGDFPCEEYHFLFQITPYKSYHGVDIPTQQSFYEKTFLMIYTMTYWAFHHMNFIILGTSSNTPVEMLP